MTSFQNINRLIAKTTQFQVGDKVALKVLEGREQTMRGGEILALDNNGQTTVLLAGDAKATTCQVWELTDYADWSQKEAERFAAAALITKANQQIQDTLDAYNIKDVEVKLVNDRWHLVFGYKDWSEYDLVNAMLLGIQNPPKTFTNWPEQEQILAYALGIYNTLDGDALKRPSGIILSGESLQAFISVANGDMDIAEIADGRELSEALYSESFDAELVEIGDKLSAALGRKVKIAGSLSCDRGVEVYAQFSQTAALRVLESKGIKYEAKLPSECKGSGKEKAELSLSTALSAALGGEAPRLADMWRINHREYAAAFYTSLGEMRRMLETTTA